MSEAGLKQSQAYTLAAQKLTEAKKNLDAVMADSEATTKQKQDAKDRLIAAQAARNVAYKAYTNPFNVQKTV